MAGFDFDGLMLGATWDEQVNFVSSLITEEHEGGMNAVILEMLQCFAGYLYGFRGRY